MRPVERLDAETVACEQQPAPGLVPNGKREHAVEVVDAVVAPLLVGVHDGFGVGTRAVDVTAGFELAPDERVVVDLAVEDHPDVAALVGQGLLAVPKIHNAQASMAERGLSVAVDATVVGSAMRDHVAHAGHPARRVEIELVGGDEAGNAAHSWVRVLYAARVRVRDGLVAPSTNCRNQSSSISRLHRRCPWSCRRVRCSLQRRAMADGSKIPRSWSRPSCRRSSTSSANGPRSHSATGTANPCLGRLTIDAGTRRSRSRRSRCLLLPFFSLSEVGTVAANSSNR